MFLLILLLIVIALYNIYQKRKQQSKKNSQNSKNNQNNIEPFLFVNDSTLYMPPTDNQNKPVEIQYQVPVPANHLTDLQSDSIDVDVLRNTRTLKNFSMTDEMDFYQMYNIIKQLNIKQYSINYDSIYDSTNTDNQIISSEKLISLNSGAINSANLNLFTRIKLELISALNNLMIQNNYYVQYHPYQFFKIINSNLISNTNPNYVFTLTIAREYKYQQFTVYFNVDLNENFADINNKQYTLKVNKVELIGIPIPKTIEFHSNTKIENKKEIQENSNNNIKLIDDNISKIMKDKTADIDFYYEDQVSDSANFDVMPIGEESSKFQSPNMKFIDVSETGDMDKTMFDSNSIAVKLEDKKMNISKDKFFNNHKCFGLVNGVSQALPQYKNPIFCKSYHPEVNQNGIWDAPCQVNNDCPFYKANKNYPNEFGKCDKVSGQCEMPLGVVPIGFTKYGKIEPDCYNCGSSSGSDSNKCCKAQSESIKLNKVSYQSPDYIFIGDESYRKQFANDLESVGLLVNPSI